MSSANRSCSPITRPTPNNKRIQELVLDDGKIHRIRLVSPAICLLSHVVSPNCVWFKLANHVTKKLQYTKPCILRGLGSSAQGAPIQLMQFDYVMAPLEEKIYARARIIWLQKFTRYGELPLQFAYVHFIDEGHGAWMNVNCLATMERSFYCHPWQAFPVALFKLSPGINLYNLEGHDQWPDHVNAHLEQILSEYEYFRVVPVPNSAKVNTYYEYIRADVHALSDINDKDGKSIAKMLALDMPMFQRSDVYQPSEYMQRRWFDADQQKLIDQDTDVLTDEILAEIPKWRTQDESGDAYDPDWDPYTDLNAYPSVEPCTIDTLRQQRYFVAGRKNTLNVCVEWKSLRSPDEFFAFPLKEGQTMEELYDDHRKWANTLDSFYGQPTNRKAIIGAIVKNMFFAGRKVFGMFEWNDEVTSGSYRRVEVLAVRNKAASDYSSEFCRIRFIDVGGIDIVPLAGLLAIHSLHCKVPLFVYK
uniref:Uncharacterized protein n=1 Tax=Ditylenchus dipsaci TaxID=166011 RepID=A0A915DTT3_9BILA